MCVGGIKVSAPRPRRTAFPRFGAERHDPRPPIRPSPRRDASRSPWSARSPPPPWPVPATGDNRQPAGVVVTPGDFTGYGFDQCLAPTQKAMNKWLQVLAVPGRRHLHLRHVPRLPGAAEPDADLDQHPARQAAGGCCRSRSGPQASLPAAVPALLRRREDRPDARRRQVVRRGATPRGSPRPRRPWSTPRRSGIPAGSTLWYDLEGFDVTNTACRESALRFLSGWTTRLHELGYVSGVYSSAGSGLKALDDARVERPGLIVLPDRIWIARWDGRADTSTSYLREDGWRPGGPDEAVRRWS